MTSPTISIQELIKLIRAQAKSADMWIGEWEKYKDVSSVRNAALAIGKVSGLHNALLAVNGGEIDVPDDIIALMQKYHDIWDNLHISKAIASAIANHS